MRTRQVQNDNSKKFYPCIWMQAGVVKKKYCTSDYDCPSCRYDKALLTQSHKNKQLREKGGQLIGKRGGIEFWKDKIIKTSSSPFSRPCVHSMKQRINFRPCFQDYHCTTCEFDQFFTDEFTVHTVPQPIDVLNVKGFKMPQGFYLHEGHTWVKMEEEGEVRIGFDDFIMRTLGPMNRIAAPLIGQVLKRNRSDIQLKRGTYKANVQSPVSGVVTAVNPDLMNHPHLANQSPYSKGWVLRVHPKNLRKDLKNLMIGKEAINRVSRDVDTLIGMIEQYSGPLAADGGELAGDIFGCLPEIGWDRLTRSFLRT